MDNNEWIIIDSGGLLIDLNIISNISTHERIIENEE